MQYVYHQVYHPSLSVEGDTASLVHFGEYRYMSEAYSALSRFVKESKLVPLDGVQVDYVKNEINTQYKDRYVTVLSVKICKDN